MNATSASRDTANETCAIASFAPGTDVTQATVGEVAPGAVTDLQNRTNTLASEPVAGSAHTSVSRFHDRARPPRGGRQCR